MRLPSTSFGPVQPLGVRSTIMGQRGRVCDCAAAAGRAPSSGCAGSPASASSRAAARAWWTSAAVPGRRPFHEERVIPVAAQQTPQLLAADAGQHRGVGDLVAVQVQDGQHRPVGGRIQELVGVPGSGQGPGLRLPVAHHAGHDQVRVVEGRPEGVGQGVAQLPALVDGARGLGRHVAGDPSGKGELLEQPLQPRLVLGDLRIILAVGPFQVRVGHQARARRVRARSRRSCSGRTC